MKKYFVIAESNYKTIKKEVVTYEEACNIYDEYSNIAKVFNIKLSVSLYVKKEDCKTLIQKEIICYRSEE